MPTILLTAAGVLIFFMGASIFSFLNVVAYRLPRKMDYIKGRSICPDCGRTLRGIHMVPVLSWIFLRGKCSFCKVRISVRYLLTELLGGMLALLSVHYYGISLRAVVVFLFLCVLTVVAIVDLDTMEIANGLIIWAAIIGIVSIFIFPEITWISRLIGIFSVSLPLLLITLAVPGGFGGGDIKLMAACGLFLGWKLSLISLAFAILTGGTYGIWLIITRKKGRKEHFAFGPFLSLGMAATLFWGEAVWNWYLGFF